MIPPAEEMNPFAINFLVGTNRDRIDRELASVYDDREARQFAIAHHLYYFPPVSAVTGQGIEELWRLVICRLLREQPLTPRDLVLVEDAEIECLQYRTTLRRFPVGRANSSASTPNDSFPSASSSSSDSASSPAATAADASTTAHHALMASNDDFVMLDISGEVVGVFPTTGKPPALRKNGSVK